MAGELSASLTLSREEIAHIYQGGVLSVKIKGKDTTASIEISCLDAPPSRGTHIRFKHIRAD
ncbi:MAG: hypothetical protein JRH07_14450 [Deltaproteobacteria bacterium]|nr:hypothetical protein [Deltaproteobacteria bacterium]MBW2123023.1 hypothetical protein [Deltaproteobacteria bacterium]